MSICDSGIKCKTIAGKIFIDVQNSHPLIKLAQVLPWQEMFDLVLEDLKQTAAGKWYVGRKLKVRAHLGAYLLQQLYNKTDRQTEYEIKDNAAFQIFCGCMIVDKWRAPDHTKIEEFRSRLSSNTQQQLANLMAANAVQLGFANPSDVDIDSTVQEANMTYPADSSLLKKLGGMANKVAKFFNKTLPEHIIAPIVVNLKKISSTAREYFFLPKTAEQAVKSSKMQSLLDVVRDEIAVVVNACENISETIINASKWNVKRTILQIRSQVSQYLRDVQSFIDTGFMVPTKILSFHLKDVMCVTKNKLGKKYQFGRIFQLGRIGGNFMFVDKNTSVAMPDKSSLGGMIKEHGKVFSDAAINSVATDKGYYSDKNEKLLKNSKVIEIGIQRPSNIKRKPPQPITQELTDKLVNRRSGIEPLIGHLKQGWQLGRSRMKSDNAMENSGYAAVLGFNMRQLIRQEKLSRKQLTRHGLAIESKIA